MTIGDRLRRERLRAGLTQAEIANRIRVSSVFVWMVEHGQRKPSRSLVDRWARAAGAVEADVLLEGPALFDVSFAVDVGGLDPFAARRVLDHLPEGEAGRVSIWPMVDSGALRLRARASALPSVIGLAGADVPAIGTLPAPTVEPVRGSDELIAWVRAATEVDALAHVEERLALAGARGSVSVQGWGRLFVAHVADLAEDASMRLQGLVEGSPIGLFVPLCGTNQGSL